MRVALHSRKVTQSDMGMTLVLTHEGLGNLPTVKSSSSLIPNTWIYMIVKNETDDKNEDMMHTVFIYLIVNTFYIDIRIWRQNRIELSQSEL